MTFLLVPGAGGQAWFWHRLALLLPDAVAVALPTGDEAAGLAAYADAVVEAGAGRSGVTVVAQSMGAFSAPLAVDRLDVERIVLVNAMVPAPGETAGAWWAATGQLAARAALEREEGRDPDAPFDPAVGFFHDLPADLVREMDELGPPAQADRPFAEPWPLDAWPDVPTSGVAGADDRLFPVEFQRRVARERLGVELDVLPGGHLLALSQPASLAAYLLGT